MYKYLVILVLATVTLAEDTDLFTDADEEKEQCIEELKLDSSKIRNFEDIEKVEDMDRMTKDEKCVLRCVLQKLGTIDAKGNVLPDELDDQIAKELNVDFSKCIPSKDITDPCEQTFVLSKCAFKLLFETSPQKS